MILRVRSLLFLWFWCMLPLSVGAFAAEHTAALGPTFISPRRLPGNITIITAQDLRTFVEAEFRKGQFQGNALPGTAVSCHRRLVGALLTR